MATKHDVYDNFEWVENQHGNTRPYPQLRNKDTGIFVPNKQGDPFHNDLYPDDDHDD